MKEDVGMSKPKRYADKVEMVPAQEGNIGLKIKQTTQDSKLNKSFTLSSTRSKWYLHRRVT